LLGNRHKRDGSDSIVKGAGDAAKTYLLVSMNVIVKKIFKPFEQLYGSNSPYAGTGMGLTICKKILNRHGGEITVRSIPGQGATFIVTLPPKQQTGG
jgi:light-regulated signal transduction histidine kinase (bacteriophytochrome)